MHITRLNIERVRNLKAVALQELQPFNVFYGHNGSGKTSILEAIHLLATGRSFRTHLPKNYIQNEMGDAIVFAQSATEKIGMQKMLSGEQLIKVNGDLIATQGQLAKILPLQHIDPQSTDIIDHGAKPRRQLIDWLMFHVEPDFYHAWQYYSRALKQRNTLLKTKRHISLQDLEPWNKMLSDYESSNANFNGYNVITDKDTPKKLENGGKIYRLWFMKIEREKQSRRGGWTFPIGIGIGIGGGHHHHGPWIGVGG